MRIDRLRFRMGWALIACLASTIGGASRFHGFAQESGGKEAKSADRKRAADSSMRLKLPAALEQLTRVVKPRADETRWRRIPWLTDLEQSQQLAKKERRPFFFFVSGDDPLEAC